MRMLLFLILVALVLLAVWLVAEAVEVDDTTTVRTWGRVRPSYVIDGAATSTTPQPRARTAPTVQSASAGRAAIAETSIRGFPCGGDLPPCSVLRRESMMAVDPPRVWNGNCYMPPGSLGQCGRSTASGLWQVLRSTWKQFGGYINAADAPVVVQNDFARQLWAGGAGCAHWRAC